MAAKFLFNDPKHWRERAEQVRVAADGMDDNGAAAIMRQIADQYEKLANRVEQRIGGDRPHEKAIR